MEHQQLSDKAEVINGKLEDAITLLTEIASDSDHLGVAHQTENYRDDLERMADWFKGIQTEYKNI